VPAANEPGSNGTLASCYKNSLKELVGQRKDTIAFPCIGTGVQRFDHERAAHIAMAAVREFFDNDHMNQVNM
jgi:O-acetyl-ADP-ribose deacetylase (regulator of RNase III)